jgi:hypothetical protein
MRGAWTPRRWIGAALVLQAVGFAYDALWHGLLHPGAEPQTRQEMVRHLVTVHLPLYIGVLSVLATTALGFAGAIRHSRSAGAWSVAAFGALLSAVGETWHAAAHLQLNTHAGAMAGSLSPVGFLIVAVATWRAREPSSGAAAADDQRRAA